MTSNIEHQTSHIPNRGHLLTEQRLDASRDLDAMSTLDVLKTINDQDATIAGVVRSATPAIAALVDTIVERMRRGGRLVYLGAGTSGRLGVLDASECPPTFHCDPQNVVGVIAGGDSALRRSSEGKEDDPDGARDVLGELNVNENDTVVGIAAGGTTPYVLGALNIAQSRGAATGLVTCVESETTRNNDASGATGGSPASAPDAPNTGGQAASGTPVGRKSLADHVVALPVGPEVVTGSTRMKAGTATKMALNMISTAVMVALGKTWGNLMVDLRATNAKLRDRAARILTSQCDLSRDDALALLDRADGRVKTALVMAKLNVERDEAERRIAEHGGQLRPLLGEPR